MYLTDPKFAALLAQVLWEDALAGRDHAPEASDAEFGVWL